MKLNLLDIMSGPADLEEEREVFGLDCTVNYSALIFTDEIVKEERKLSLFSRLIVLWKE